MHNLGHIIKLGYQAEQSPSRIGKCLTYIGAIGYNADISRMVYDFKIFHHSYQLLNYIIYYSKHKL